ncbi:MAG TPA: hypothetical protein VKA46_14780 [Gemmataceae bacterium]|nr:hypothetical protein [Gemmataceae bacterium]
MSRKSVLFGSGILLFFAGTTGAALVSLVRHEPSFYRRAAVPPGAEREALSAGCFSQAVTFFNSVRDSDRWRGTFSEEQINGYLEEGFLRNNVKSLTLPDHITDPRVAFEPDRIRLGFRYHLGQFSTVVSIDMRVWLTKAEPNVVALEIQGMRAGALPISAQSILERLSEAAESNNVKLSWYRHEGNPVAILRFQGEQRSNLLLENLDLRPGTIDIQGQSLEPVAPVTATAAKP